MSVRNLQEDNGEIEWAGKKSEDRTPSTDVKNSIIYKD